MENDRNKLLLINFDVNTLIYCLGTNLVQFQFLKTYNLIQLISFVPKWSHWLLNNYKEFMFFIKIHILHLNICYYVWKIEFNVWKLQIHISKNVLFNVQLKHFFLYLMVFCLKWYSHFKHFSLLGFHILSSNIWRKKHLSIRS